jgi:hypothetical protein
MNTTRRGLLGMFAAGVAAAVLPSGVAMPVRKIIVPSPLDVAILAGEHAGDALPWMMFQDMECRIPVTAIGQPVAVIRSIGTINGDLFDARQPVACERPIWGGGRLLKDGALVLPGLPPSAGESWHMELPGGVTFEQSDAPPLQRRTTLHSLGIDLASNNRRKI